MALPKGVKSQVDYTKLYMSNELEGETISEKALSKKQQRFFGIVRAIQKGEQEPTTPETAKAAADMKKSDVKKYASTKHTKLPEKIEEKLDKDDKPFVKKLVGKLRKGSKTHAKQADDLEKAMNEDMSDKDFKKLNKDMHDTAKAGGGASQEIQNKYALELARRRKTNKDGTVSTLTNKALKNEETAIESELVIQDWNVDDIKFTEIETVDIIKAKPLKENRNTMGTEKQLTRSIESIKGGQKIEIPDNTRGPNYSPIKPKIKDKNKFPKIKIKSLKDFEKEAKKVRTEQKSNWRDELEEDWQKVNRKDKTDGLSRKAVKAYRRENPGSKLQTAVTTKPSKLKKGSKSAKRRLSFCRRMKGMKKKLTSAKTRRDPDSRINKALRRWNC